jgi:hypothetical protein
MRQTVTQCVYGLQAGRDRNGSARHLRQQGVSALRAHMAISIARVGCAVPTLGVLFAAFRMQSQRQDPSVVLEVLVSRKDRERSTGSYRADEEIDTRALDTGRTAAVGEGSRLLIVSDTYRRPRRRPGSTGRPRKSEREGRKLTGPGAGL